MANVTTLDEDAYDGRYLVVLRFSRGAVFYTSEFEVRISGLLWPRELRAAMQIIDIYKEQNKVSNGKKAEVV